MERVVSEKEFKNINAHRNENVKKETQHDQPNLWQSHTSTTSCFAMFDGKNIGLYLSNKVVVLEQYRQ